MNEQIYILNKADYMGVYIFVDIYIFQLLIFAQVQ